MSACLVKQIFRQKVNYDIDLGVVDEFIFPFIRQRKHPPKELLVDIKLTRDKLIMPGNTRRSLPSKSLPPFTPYEGMLSAVLIEGMVTSSWRRKNINMHRWGSVDILNQLRELKHPQVGKHRSYTDDLDFPGEEFEHAYIRLEENSRRPPPRISPGFGNTERTAINDWGFVNDFLENALSRRLRISWYGTYHGSPEQPILSLH
jgi:hypothetical protein